mmetsp:Transcript_17548/g.27330  ORF Transcript_17548/g.27330 Transcript_17548/m.27330 type:complete len:188 (-) Transcript_17548:311-874(-)|eukprot:CAMPEP_0196809292 /NCGR_PEP_ID=MMETSP1362-20130617/9243_1 /TAXON_ID=163516 /ORGANISM="Leptocylindrus danicus, Strain CCMP1856" /LENGTH=187 /DNA_ID=CAMNT_0042183929 /DNA_START=92 /DNA_END=655 /DNA_ORIENTATION=+
MRVILMSSILASVQIASAFVSPSTTCFFHAAAAGTSTCMEEHTLSSTTFPTRLFAGGWGKRKKEFVEDEFARSDGNRRGFERYELQERSDFLRRVKAERNSFLKKKDEEYLSIARAAGITDQSGDGVEPMGEFDVDDEDDLDVSVSWEEMDGSDGDEQLGPTVKYDPDSSITRLDNDLDISGRTGQW